MERRDIEDAFKMEIAELEDKHIREKNDMVKEFNEQRVGHLINDIPWLNSSD